MAAIPCVICYCCMLIKLCCVAFALLFPVVHSKWVKGDISTSADWTFITRFCFLSQNGHFNYQFKYPKSYGIQQLLLYYDAPGQWESVYKSEKNCTERRSILNIQNNQIIDLTTPDLSSTRSAGCSVYSQDGADYYNCTADIMFSTARERWWYLVIARCTQAAQSGLTGLRLDYTIHMTNGDPGDILHHEMSADEFYILPVDITFLLVYLIVLAVSIVCAVALQKRQMFHTTYKMYMVAVGLWTFGLFLLSIAWGMYGNSGWEEGPTEVTGRIFQAASTIVFILVLLLLSKGFSVTRGRLTQMSTVRLTAFFSLYIIAYITLFLWEGLIFDEGIVLYFYESPPGYGLIAMRLIGWLWFLYGFVFTMKNYPEKSKFYIPFFVFYTLWFWAGPIVTLIAIYNIAKWTREKTVNGVEQFVGLCGHLFFLILTRPSAANKNFPFHLRTTQVSFSNDEEVENRYTPSEESREHLERIFVVQRPVNGSTHRSVDHPNGSHHFSNRGYVNSSHSSKPRLNPPIEATAPSMSNGHLPPLHTETSPPLSTGLNSTLSPLHTGTSPPLSTGLNSALSPLHTETSPPHSTGLNSALPPLHTGTSPPLSTGQNSALSPLQNGTSLPPLPSDLNPVLPPLRSGALPPIPGHGSKSLVSDE